MSQAFRAGSWTANKSFLGLFILFLRKRPIFQSGLRNRFIKCYYEIISKLMEYMKIYLYILCFFLLHSLLSLLVMTCLMHFTPAKQADCLQILMKLKMFGKKAEYTYLILDAYWKSQTQQGCASGGHWAISNFTCRGKAIISRCIVCYLFVGSCSREMSCRWMYHQPPMRPIGKSSDLLWWWCWWWCHKSPNK